jgi:hypothetical protein
MHASFSSSTKQMSKAVHAATRESERFVAVSVQKGRHYLFVTCCFAFLLFSHATVVPYSSTVISREKPFFARLK